MIAFDANVLSDFLAGKAAALRRAEAYSVDQLSIPLVVVEEVLRGRLHCVRQAEAAKYPPGIVRAYDLLQESVRDATQMTILPYTDAADLLFCGWRKDKIRVGTHDLRIAAICVSYPATLATRNRRDFEKVPGLSFEIWD